MTEPQVKNLIEKICMNECHSKIERSVKLETSGIPKGMLVVDTHTALLAQIELLNKQLAEGCLNKANAIQVQALKYDFFGGGHENGRCSLEGVSEEAQFETFQKNNPCSNTYNLRWKDRPKFRWSNNKNQSGKQVMQ